MTDLRTYELNTPQHKLYSEMYKYQTLNLVKEKRKEYSQLKKKCMSIHSALNMLDDFVDPSDPDLDVPNSIHAYQTAERIRKKYPDDKELQIIGLIHDLGKVLFSFDEPSFLVVGDTFALGCEIPKTIVYYESSKLNPDFDKYDKLGIYKEKCGLNNLILSYGHDEYLYQVLNSDKNKKKHLLTDKYLDVIRYHSFYPWHTSGEYKIFMKDEDYITLDNVLKFNEFDLYSKEDPIEITQEVKEYYTNLLNEFFYEDLLW